MAIDTKLHCIAIVDDQRSVTSLLSALLEHEGYKTVSFNDGSEFLKYQ